jgi:hypothetical protein
MNCLSVDLRLAEGVLHGAAGLRSQAHTASGFSWQRFMLCTVIRKLFTGLGGLLRRGARRLRVFPSCTRKNDENPAEKLRFCDGFMLTGNRAIITPRELGIKKTGACKIRASWRGTSVAACAERVLPAPLGPRPYARIFPVCESSVAPR